MQSKKPIYKKAYEPVDNVDESVWLGNDTPVMESDSLSFSMTGIRVCLGTNCLSPRRITLTSWAGPTAWPMIMATNKSKKAR